MSKAIISKVGQMFFLDFFNSKNVYSVKGFDTERRARNYAKKYSIELHTELPEGVEKFVYND